jgi:hypothetical protein
MRPIATLSGNSNSPHSGEPARPRGRFRANIQPLAFRLGGVADNRTPMRTPRYSIPFLFLTPPLWRKVMDPRVDVWMGAPADGLAAGR